jgi:hypothetical protein
VTWCHASIEGTIDDFPCVLAELFRAGNTGKLVLALSG